MARGIEDGKRLNIYVSGEDADALERLADDNGDSLSGYVRRLIRSHIKAVQK